MVEDEVGVWFEGRCGVCERVLATDRPRARSGCVVDMGIIESSHVCGLRLDSVLVPRGGVALHALSRDYCPPQCKKARALFAELVPLADRGVRESEQRTETTPTRPHPLRAHPSVRAAATTTTTTTHNPHKALT